MPRKKNASEENPTPHDRKSSQDSLVYQEIFDAVLSQRLLPGTKLTEEDLADIFSVSRTIIRRALLRLTHDKIVVSKPNRGAYVASPDVRQAREILHTRSLIESEIVKQAVENIDDQNLEILRNTVQKEKKRFENGDRGSGIRLSGDFHLTLAKIADNSTLLDILMRLVPQTSLIIAQYERPGHAHCSHDEHFQLIDVIEARDAEGACQIMRAHIQHIEDKLQLSGRDALSDLRDIFSQTKP